MGVDLAPKPEVDENNPYYETPVQDLDFKSGKSIKK